MFFWILEVGLLLPLYSRSLWPHFLHCNGLLSHILCKEGQLWRIILVDLSFPYSLVVQPALTRIPPIRMLCSELWWLELVLPWFCSVRRTSIIVTECILLATSIEICSLNVEKSCFSWSTDVIWRMSLSAWRLKMTNRTWGLSLSASNVEHGLSACSGNFVPKLGIGISWNIIPNAVGNDPNQRYEMEEPNLSHDPNQGTKWRNQTPTPHACRFCTMFCLFKCCIDTR